MDITKENTDDNECHQQTVLIIEDNHYDFLLMKHIILSQYPNINIIYAQSLGDAYDIYKNHNYDFVLLDLNLPDGYGTGTIQEVKKYHGHVPIITISGVMTESIENNAMRMGASAVLSKDMLSKPAFMDVIQDAVLWAKGNAAEPYYLNVGSHSKERERLRSNEE